MRLLSALALVLLSVPALAQEPKVVYDPVLADGTVLVEDTLYVRYVGDWREPVVRPDVLSTSWTTATPSGKTRKVLVTEERAPGQDEMSWKLEHKRLVSKVAASFPPTTPERKR